MALADVRPQSRLARLVLIKRVFSLREFSNRWVRMACVSLSICLENLRALVESDTLRDALSARVSTRE